MHGVRHFGSPLAGFPFTHQKVYIAVTALVINLVVSVVATLVLRAARAPAGGDDTHPDDYYSDSASPAVRTAAAEEVGAIEGAADAVARARLAR